MKMRAMIFAAGLGTRLKPLTDTMPKAMVPINGKPLIQIQIEKLISQGYRDIVVNVHHFADQIIDFLRRNDNFGINIQISDETERLLDTGGGLQKAFPMFNCADDDAILVHNVDILSNLDFHTIDNETVLQDVSFNGKKEQAGAVLLVSRRKTSRYLLFDDNDLLVGWTNIDTGQVKTPYKSLDVSKCKKYAFSGIHLFGAKAYKAMESFTAPFGITDFYLSVCDKIPIKGLPSSDLKLIDVGKLSSLADAESFYATYYKSSK